MTELYRVQHCYDFISEGVEPLWISFSVGEFRHDVSEDEDIFCGFSIKMNAEPKKHRKYPDLRYFLVKKNNPQEMKRSHLRDDIRGSDVKGNAYTNSTCDKWEYRRIDYHQGYHDFMTFYEHVSPGHYILFIKTEEDMQIRIRIDSHVPIERLEQEINLPEITRR